MVQFEITGAKVRGVARPLLMLLLAVLLVWGLVALVDDLGEDEDGPTAARSVIKEVDAKRYQAVILANDRVYFGHLRWAGGEVFLLKDAYFIRTRSEGAGKAATTKQQVAPIGEELHGPEPEVILMAEQVVQVENLRADSPVAKAIDGLRSAS